MRWVDAATATLFVSSVALWLVTRRGRPAQVLTLGLAYEVFLCGILAITEAFFLPVHTFPPRPSFMVLVLLTFPLVVPATPRRRLLTTAACLMALPLESVIAIGFDAPPLHAYSPLMYFPTLVAGIFAILL